MPEMRRGGSRKAQHRLENLGLRIREDTLGRVMKEDPYLHFPAYLIQIERRTPEFTDRGLWS
ncbi:hypothetical protein AKJ62_03290 [candidate division MSBL1 archaeon SCGC-AAA259D14]|uniref:Uncharacterized protein n=1 Tax=candidate division MSBL1 archaeon SCGC-AAA259D14 TaxID=1698261 RepID=A0A133U577_9EURY|nr:hypothetical protein AKJ62_03290 [candidate division MSBL1 archaeon SCGC-AAA259D14]